MIQEETQNGAKAQKADNAGDRDCHVAKSSAGGVGEKESSQSQQYTNHYKGDNQISSILHDTAPSFQRLSSILSVTTLAYQSVCCVTIQIQVRYKSVTGRERFRFQDLSLYFRVTLVIINYKLPSYRHIRSSHIELYLQSYSGSGF